MSKTILITGSTDGIGLATAIQLASLGHHVLLHGRSAAKLAEAERLVRAEGRDGSVESFAADLSRLSDVEALATAIAARPGALDVLINNAGVFRLGHPMPPNQLDVRFVVNTVAPYLLTRRLLPELSSDGRVVNLSSAAQAPVQAAALSGEQPPDDSAAYAQSKLALTMWSNHLARELGPDGPVVVAVNPGSFLGTKMVKEAYGTSGNDIGIGADILVRAATSSEFADASGQYYDNDSRRFASPHPDALDPLKNASLVERLELLIAAGTS
ncbi:MAG: SDR family NAD(P)-dependent oxidoreductase [Actinomycetota bacterium]